MRVGIVCEGRTDFVLLEQIVVSVFGPCEVDPVQPMRDALRPGGWQEAGWTQVRAWCRARDADVIADEMTLGGLDAFVIQVDGDLCGREGLPATRPALCAHIRGDWLGGGVLPHGVVICIPAAATDTWLWAAVESEPLPDGLEDEQRPTDRLGEHGIGKNQHHYGSHAEVLGRRLPVIREALSELDRFLCKLEGVSEMPSG